jgi:hypothetical protein
MRENLPFGRTPNTFFRGFLGKTFVAPSLLYEIQRLRLEFQPLDLKQHEYRPGSVRKTLLSADERSAFAF